MGTKHGENFSLQDYLKAIAKLEAQDNAATVTGLADILLVKKPSVTQMLRRLSDEKLISWAPRKDIKLTRKGRILSNTIIRNHRIIETFFSRFLKLDLLEAHLEAEKLEHVISQSVVDKMYALCGKPASDPHGQRIPALDAANFDHLRRARTHLPLNELELGARATVVEFCDADEKNLKSVLQNSFQLDDKVQRLSQTEFLLNGKKKRLDTTCLSSVLVEKAGAK